LGIPALLVVGESSFIFVRLFVANRRLYSFGCDLFCSFVELCCYGVWFRWVVVLRCLVSSACPRIVLRVRSVVCSESSYVFLWLLLLQSLLGYRRCPIARFRLFVISSIFIASSLIIGDVGIVGAGSDVAVVTVAVA